MSRPEDAARAYDRACLIYLRMRDRILYICILIGHYLFERHLPYVCRDDPLLRRFVRMDVEEAPLAAAGSPAPSSILLPHVSAENFVDALRQQASLACGAPAGSGALAGAGEAVTPPIRGVAPSDGAGQLPGRATAAAASAAASPGAQSFRGVSIRQGRFIAQIGCGTNSSKTRVMCVLEGPLPSPKYGCPN